MLSFDRLMDAVVGDGNYQLLLLAIVTSLSISSAFMMTGSVFLGKFLHSMQFTQANQNGPRIRA